MPHVLRDADGRIIGVLDRAFVGGTEELPGNDPELLAFLEQVAGPMEEQRRAFMRADLEFIRVLEDLVAALMERNVISLTDLPTDAQRKVLSRSALRQMLNQHTPMIIPEDSERLF